MSDPIRLFDPDSDCPGALRVADVIGSYLDNLADRVQAGDYDSEGIKDVRRDLLRFAEHFGNRRLEDCVQKDLADWLAMNPQWRSNYTKRRNLCQIVACFNWAADEELGNLTKIRAYRLPSKIKLPCKPRRDAEPSEYIALMRCPNRGVRRVLFFLRRTGARPSEAFELEFSQIDWQRGNVVKEKHKTVRYTGEPRVFGLEPCVFRFLRNLFEHREPGQTHVFLNGCGRPWNRNSFGHRLRHWARRIGLDAKAGDRVTAYCMRHSFATWAIEAGCGERQIADQLGHVDTRMIRVYSHAAKKRAYLRGVAMDAVRRRKNLD